MRNFVVFLCSFVFSVYLVGCSGMSNPLQATPTATSSRISSGSGGGGGGTPADTGEGTVIFNDHLNMSSGGLVNPIRSLPTVPDQGQDAEDTVTSGGTIWPDEVRNPANEGPEPDAVTDGTPTVDPDEVDDDGGVGDDSEDDSDDGLSPEVVDDDTSDDDSGGDGDDGDLWGEVVD